MKTSAIISGSFDPITNGHVWLVQEALKLVETVHFVIATNPNKTPMFTAIERFEMAFRVFDYLGMLDRVEVRLLPAKTMLVEYAREFGCDLIVRGLRNATDFEYEHTIDMVQRKVNPEVRTVYLMTPHHLTEVSSSMVKSLVGLNGWERVVSDYVPQEVFNRLPRAS